MLSGDNGILQRATQSKERTEKATVIELAKTDILGQIAENKGETISGTQLKIILNKYFEDFDDELPEDLSETTITLIAKEEYGGYTNIALSDIYSGKLKTENVDTHTYHMTIIGYGTYGGYAYIKPGKTLKIYLYDENETQKPIIADYDLRSSEGECSLKADGTAEISSFRWVGSPTLCTITLTINDQELSENFYLMPPD